MQVESTKNSPATFSATRRFGLAVTQPVSERFGLPIGVTDLIVASLFNGDTGEVSGLNFGLQIDALVCIEL